MKITIVTGVWKRPEVFKLFAEGLKAIPFDFEVIVAGSEGRKSKTMVEQYGFTYLETRNRPLSTKMNQTTIKAKGSDYVVCMGSDDIISVPLWNELLLSMLQGHDIIGLEDLYFYQLKNKKALYWGGYRGERKGKTTGVARCLSKRVMSALDWECWDNRINKYLDASMTKRIANTGLDFTYKNINLKEKGLFAVDIKTGVNITPFAKWDNTEFIDPKIIQKEFDYLSL